MRLLPVLLLLVLSVRAEAQYPWGYTWYPPSYGSPPPTYVPGDPAPRPAPSSPSSLAHAMLAAHNAIRARVGVPPLVWSGTLAAAAQSWARNLADSRAFFHRPNDQYGENLYAITGGTASPNEVVSAWATEAAGYNDASNTCAGVCGHYTQIVWRATREVGCAVAAGPDREVWVCEYNPPGNVVGYRAY